MVQAPQLGAKKQKRGSGVTVLTGKMSEKGAAAVEFALVVPLLLLLVVGIFDFGRAYNVQITLTQAARAAARSMVVENDPVKANAAALLNTVGITGVAIAYSSPACAKDVDMTVTAKYTVNTIGGILPINLTGGATMRCGG